MFKQYWPLLLLIAACTSNRQPDKSIHFNYSAVDNIEFKLQPLPAKKEGLKTTEWTKTVSLEISQRFTEAGYPIHSSFNASSQPASHALIAQAEETRITKTQPGFTLDFGNPNPRSTNFQKTFSAPISCTLKSLEDPAQSVSLKELKSISSPFDNIGSSQQKIDSKLKRFYIENIGSTCHNLLKKLHVKTTSNAKSTPANTGTFSPAVRIETKYKSEDNKSLSNKTINKTGNKNINQTKDIYTIDTTAETVKKIKDEAIKNNRTEPREEAKITANKEIKKKTSKEVTEQEYFPTISTEEKNSHDWRDAEVTIFNQGDTVILEFGNNR